MKRKRPKRSSTGRETALFLITRSRDLYKGLIYLLGYRNLYYKLPVFLLALFVLTLSISYYSLSEIRGEMKVAMCVCMYVLYMQICSYQ